MNYCSPFLQSVPVRWLLQPCVCLPHQVSADLWQDGDWGYLSDSLVLSISMHMSSRRLDPVYSSPCRPQFYSGLSFPCFPSVSGPCMREQAPVTALLSLHCGPQPDTFLKAEPSSSNCSPFLSLSLSLELSLSLIHSPFPSLSSSGSFFPFALYLISSRWNSSHAKHLLTQSHFLSVLCCLLLDYLETLSFLIVSLGSVEYVFQVVWQNTNEHKFWFI